MEDSPAFAQAFDATIAAVLSPTPTNDPIRQAWNDAVTDYLRLKALSDADFLIGSMFASKEAVSIAEHDLEVEYGKAFRSVPAARARLEAALDGLREAEGEYAEAFGKPMWAAEKRLACAPAPDLQALLFKVEFIRREELSADVGVAEQAMAIMRADAARLAASSAYPATNGADDGPADRRTVWGAAMVRFSDAGNEMRRTEAEAAAAEFGTAEAAALAMPAPDLRAVAWKLGRLRAAAPHCMLDPRDFDAIIADVDRLAGDL